MAGGGVYSGLTSMLKGKITLHIEAEGVIKQEIDLLPKEELVVMQGSQILELETSLLTDLIESNKPDLVIQVG